MLDEKIENESLEIRSAKRRHQRASRLKRARLTQDFSIRQLALLTGISQGTLKRLENGESEIRIKDLELIALYTKQPLSWLLSAEQTNLGGSNG